MNYGTPLLGHHPFMGNHFGAGLSGGSEGKQDAFVLATKVADVQRALCLTSTKIHFGVVSNSGLCHDPL